MPHAPAPPMSPLDNATRPNTRAATASAHQRTPIQRENHTNHINHKTPRMRANINIATLNMNGLSAPTNNMSYLDKWSMINQTLNKFKIAILAIQETHLDEETTNRIRISYGKKMNILTSYNPENPRTTAGVAFVINKSLIAPSKIVTHELIPGRALAIEIEWLETETTRLVNIYAPNNRTTHRPFWNEIDATRRDKRIPKPDFVLGDFNVTEELIDRAPTRLDDQNAIEALRDLRHAWEIHDAWRLAYPNEKTYTYRANTNNGHIKSRLDRIYVARQATPMTFNWKTCPTPVPTDHWMVAVKYAPKDAPEIGNGRWTLPTRALKDESLTQSIIDRGIRLQYDLEDIKRRQVSRDLSNPQRLWQHFKRDISAIAKARIKATYYKINTHIRLLEKDIKTLENDENADTDDKIRSESAFLTTELEYLEKKSAQDRKNTLNAELADHGEIPGGIWTVISKEKKPRDMIRRLMIPESNPPQYERNSRRMARLAKNYHENLQNDNLENNDEREFEEKIEAILNKIHPEQILTEPDLTKMNKEITEEQVRKALHLSKNGSATGMDGCPYELWKLIEEHHNQATQRNKPCFDITKTLAEVFTDIQRHGVDEYTDFALGWMCPIYKKKDRTEISNYRPITLLNTDYKLLTKALALQLMEHIPTLVHKDQAGFIPKRSIFDHIRLAKAIISYADITENDGAIVALDQEKAYDKIRHDYLWKTLEAFNLPETFTGTIKALYQNAKTQVAINGMLSEPFKITRGIRQGDPLSCPIFDLGIEPLACMIRTNPDLKGIRIPGLKEPIKINLFADDTNLYLSKDDRFDHAQETLQEWCQTSGAKFNIEKTEIIPIGSEHHRQQVTRSRKINQEDQEPMNERVRIAEDGDAVRSLGAWIGNNTNDITPWEAILDKTHKNLERWKKTHPTMKGRKAIVQIIVGGYTQFLTKAQGMPTHIESALTKMIRDFMWEDDSSPRIALELLQRPIEEGGLNLLDLKARNEAIEIVWLKSYLDLSPTRPTWAIVTDLIIDTSAPTTMCDQARGNPFLQTWNIPMKGRRAEKLNNDIVRMVTAAQKYDANLAAIRLTPQLKSLLPAWYHIAADPRPITNVESKCLLNTHETTRVADLIQMSARLREPQGDRTHLNGPQCICQDCVRDRRKGCKNPHACAVEARIRIENIAPKLNPNHTGDNRDNLTLTRNRKQSNEAARRTQGEIIFDPTITCKDDLSECFRIFTNPNQITNIPASRPRARGVILRNQQISAYTDGACFENGKANARCGSGIWFGPNQHRNKAIRIPGEEQSNQVGEIAAIIITAETIPQSWPLKIYTDSQYVIDGLTMHLRDWENNGWIGVKNAALFKKAAYVLRKRSAPTVFQWVKGHSGVEGNEESDQLAKDGANKATPDELNLDIPREFDLQGAKLATITQAIAYRGILERRGQYTRPATANNLERARDAVARYTRKLETDKTIWHGLQKPTIRVKIRQFLYKAMHETQKIGNFWAHIPGYEERQNCTTCNVPETMSHILILCRALPTHTIWNLAKDHWPQSNPQWPEISLGIILGCGSIERNDLPNGQNPNDENDQDNQRTHTNAGAARLLQILLTESAHLIWVLRCERVIQGRNHETTEITKRWRDNINKRLTEDRITATVIKQDKASIHKVRSTWEGVLEKTRALPNDWLHNREVLVGRRA